VNHLEPPFTDGTHGTVAVVGGSPLPLCPIKRRSKEIYPRNACRLRAGAGRGRTFVSCGCGSGWRTGRWRRKGSWQCDASGFGPPGSGPAGRALKATVHRFGELWQAAAAVALRRYYVPTVLAAHRLAPRGRP